MPSPSLDFCGSRGSPPPRTSNNSGCDAWWEDLLHPVSRTALRLMLRQVLRRRLRGLMAGFYVIPGQLLWGRVVGLLTSPLLPLFRYRLKESEEWGAGRGRASASGIGGGLVAVARRLRRRARLEAGRPLGWGQWGLLAGCGVEGGSVLGVGCGYGLSCILRRGCSGLWLGRAGRGIGGRPVRFMDLRVPRNRNPVSVLDFLRGCMFPLRSFLADPPHPAAACRNSRSEFLPRNCGAIPGPGTE